MSGTMNQKNGSGEPTRRSFLVKSICVSVALLPHPQNPDEVGRGGVELVWASETDKHVSANSTSGRDWRRHRSRLSENDIKYPVSSYTRNCLRRTNATISSGNAAKTVRYRMYSLP